ncbi:MAG: hypothetical protein LBG24_11010 [Treponema sp.]|nr:hypothetical protein [Treponema sp.]
MWKKAVEKKDGKLDEKLRGYIRIAEDIWEEENRDYEYLDLEELGGKEQYTSKGVKEIAAVRPHNRIRRRIQASRSSRRDVLATFLTSLMFALRRPNDSTDFQLLDKLQCLFPQKQYERLTSAPARAILFKDIVQVCSLNIEQGNSPLKGN